MDEIPPLLPQTHGDDEFDGKLGKFYAEHQNFLRSELTTPIFTQQNCSRMWNQSYIQLNVYQISLDGLRSRK